MHLAAVSNSTFHNVIKLSEKIPHEYHPQGLVFLMQQTLPYPMNMSRKFIPSFSSNPNDRQVLTSKQTEAKT